MKKVCFCWFLLLCGWLCFASCSGPSTDEPGRENVEDLLWDGNGQADGSMDSGPKPRLEPTPERQVETEQSRDLAGDGGVDMMPEEPMSEPKLEFIPEPRPEPVVETQPEVQPDALGVPNVAGTWAQLQVNSAFTKIPVFGETQEETKSYLLLKIKQQGKKLTYTRKTCTIKVHSRSVAKTSFPAAFLRGLPVVTIQGELRQTNGKWGLFHDKLIELRGVKLTQPATEALPTQASDPRVFDQDNDGNPGMTVKINGFVSGSVYLVQRTWSLLKGNKLNTTQMDGWIEWKAETSVIGASSGILNSNNPSRVDPKAENSYFRTTRVKNTITCADIISAGDQLYKR